LLQITEKKKKDERTGGEESIRDVFDKVYSEILEFLGEEEGC
jgi:hypothetical protein